MPVAQKIRRRQRRSCKHVAGASLCPRTKPITTKDTKVHEGNAGSDVFSSCYFVSFVGDGVMSIPENIGKVRGRIRTAAVRSGRDPREITLMAVSKTFPADRI